MIVPCQAVVHKRLLHELHGFRPNLVHLCSVLSSAPWGSALQRLQLVKQRGSREMTTRSMSGPAWTWSLQLLETEILTEEPLAALACAQLKPAADVVSYNATMDSCVLVAVFDDSTLGRQWERTLHVFEAMSWWRIVPSMVSVHAMASGCQSSGQWRKRGMLFDEDTTTKSKEAWRQSLEFLTKLAFVGLRPDLVTVNLALAAFAAGQRPVAPAPKGQLDASHGDRRMLPDEVTYGALLSARFPKALASWMLQQWQWAIHLLHEMRPDVITYNATMDACTQGQQWQRCLTLFNEMFHSILYPSIISYNTAISACEHGPWTLVIALLEDLRHQGLKARADTFSAAMVACSKAQQNDLTMELLSKVPKRFTPQRQLLMAYNSALNACARGRMWMHSLKILEEMSLVADLSPDVVSFSSAITACSKGQQWSMTLALLQDFKDRSLQMNAWLCNAAMDSFSRSFQWQAALMLLEDMERQNQRPSMVASTLAVSAAAAAKEGKVASDLLRVSRSQHSPDEAAYLGMLTACQEGSLWEMALDLLAAGRQRASECQEPPSQHLFSLAVAACEWEQALAVLASMQQDGPTPNWVVLNAVAKVLLCSGRMPEALAFYRDAEDQGHATAEYLESGRFPTADLDLHCFPVELAKLAVLTEILDAAGGGPRRSPGLLLVTGRGSHQGQAVLGPLLREWLEDDLGLPVEELLGGVTITHQDTGGSPRYMAPECFVVGSCITEKVDIWSLGCCLVEILGGPLPYENLPMMSEVQNRLKQGIPPMVPPWCAQTRGDVSRKELSVFVSKTLQTFETKLPTRRTCASWSIWHEDGVTSKRIWEGMV
eukprot:symbB.v1.2.000139.t1/scaffold16.1/size461936/13